MRTSLLSFFNQRIRKRRLIYRDRGNVSKKQKKDRDRTPVASEIGDEEIHGSPSPPLQPVSDDEGDLEDIHASLIRTGPNTPTQGRYFTHLFHRLPDLSFAGDSVAPQPHPSPTRTAQPLPDHLSGAVETESLASSQSYPDLGEYADVDANGWEILDMEIKQVATANKQDLTFLRSFNSRSISITWRNGYKTALPWAGSGEPIESNLRPGVSLFLLF